MPRITKDRIFSLLRDHRVEPTRSSLRDVKNEHLGILISSRGNLLAMAKNRSGTRSQGCGWSDYTLHAELAVIKKLGNKELLRGAILIVVRLTNDPDHFINSHPCDTCKLTLTKHMRDDGLRAVYYSLSE